jgi:hypothetical protein
VIDPEVREFLRSAAADMMPKMEGSAIALIIFNGTIDALISVQLGAAILMDKPIVLIVVDKKEQLPAALLRVATEVVYGSMKDPGTKDRLKEAIVRILPSHGII